MYVATVKTVSKNMRVIQRWTDNWNLILIALICYIVPLINAHERSASTEPGFLFKEDFHTTKLGLPYTLNVGLLGLEGNGENNVELSPSVLQDILTRSYSTHVPSALDKGCQLNVVYDIQYGVHHIAHFHIKQIESLLSRSMQYMETIEDTMMFEIDFSEVQSWIDRVYTDGLAQVAGTGIDRYAHTDNDEHIANMKPSVLVIAPNKSRMRPSLPPDAINATQYAYYYRYHRSSPTQVIVGGLRYVFVDLSAGPVPLIDSEAHATSDDLTMRDIVPHPQRIHSEELIELQLRSASGRSTVIETSRASTLMVAELMTVIVNSIKFVFLPDMFYRSLPHSETVIVPIIVLRNHQIFDPWQQEGGEETLLEGAEGPVNEFKIDLNLIKQQIESLLNATSVRVIFTTALHHLDDLPHLSSALNNSMQLDTITRFNIQSNQREPLQVNYINSSMLLNSLSSLTDQTLSELADLTTHHTPHSRVFPVFVYSLIGYPRDLLIDRMGLHQSNKHMAVILQTEMDNVPTRYQSQDGVLAINAQRPTHHIVAALMSSLCAITPSTLHMDMKHRFVRSYLFSIGAHPFPPFATEQSIVGHSMSLLYRDTTVRNSVVMRIKSGLRSVHRAVKHLDHAIDHYGSHLIGFADNDDGALYAFWNQRKSRSELVESDTKDEIEDEFETFLTTQITALLALERTYRKVIEHIQDPYGSTGFDVKLLQQLSLLTYTESHRFEQSIEASVQSLKDTYSTCSFSWSIDKESPEAQQRRTSLITVIVWICALIGCPVLVYFVGKRLCLFESESPYGSRSFSTTVRTRIALWSRSMPGRNKKLHGV